jgi:hypothetical protein
LDYIRIEFAVDLFAEAMKFDRTLSNPNADDNAKRLMAYMSDVYGTYVIAGQSSDRVTNNEMTAIFNATGRYPALLGVDMMRYTQPNSPNRGLASWSLGEIYAIEEALKWDEMGGALVCPDRRLGSIL